MHHKNHLGSVCVCVVKSNLHPGLGAFADYHARLVHWVNVMLQAKVGSHSVGQHPMVRVPGWQLQRVSPAKIVGSWGTIELLVIVFVDGL